ncbi:MAG: hypothetical protein ACRCTD_16245 [Beijerinckiaceae bacterium]
MRALIHRFLKDTSGTMLATTVKGAVLVTVFSVGAAWYIGERLESERRALGSLTAAASGTPAPGRGNVDMSTTGSITKNGNSTRLDPCIIIRQN